MRNIRHVLRDRQSAYEEAQILLSQNTTQQLLERMESDYDLEDGLLRQPALTEAPTPLPEVEPTPSAPVDLKQPQNRALGSRRTD